jgi:hypothetical protein
MSNNFSSNIETFTNKINEYKNYKNQKDNSVSVSLTQGDKFMNYQKRINEVTKSKRIPKQQKTVEGYTGMSDTVTGNDDVHKMPSFDLAQNTNNLIDNVKLPDNYNSNNRELMKEYNKILSEFKTLQNNMKNSTNQYLGRSSRKNNKYAGKNVWFADRKGNYYAGMYVTMDGIARWYPSADILNSAKNCNNIEWLYANSDIVFKSEWENPGHFIKMDDDVTLMTGEPMESIDQCGVSGTNVFVGPDVCNDAVLQGVYKTNKSTPTGYLGGEPGNAIIVQNPNFDVPKLRNNTYEYYASDTAVPGWSFKGGVLMNSSSAWGYPTPYPHGSQACCIQSTTAISQTFSNVEAGTYIVQLMACGRNGYDGANPININLNGTTFYTINVPVTQWTDVSASFTVSTNGTYTIEFAGAINSINNSTAIQNISISQSSGSGTMTYEMCKAAACINGYQYFGIQNGNPNTGEGYCAATNDFVSASQPGTAYAQTKVTTIWQTNTTTGAYARLTSTGVLQVVDSNGNAVWSSSGPTYGSNYIGCYNDAAMHGKPRSLINYTGNGHSAMDCRNIAQSNNATVYGSQNYFSGSGGECWESSDLNIARAAGKATTCTKASDGNMVGAGWSNAVYTYNMGIGCYIYAQSDGNLVVYRGSNPNDNQGAIWSTETNGKQKDSWRGWEPKNTKYGKSWVYNGYDGNNGTGNDGFVLYPNESLTDPSGLICLTMQSDGNLVLKTSTIGEAYAKDSNGKFMGSDNDAIAIYKTPDKSNNDNYGKLSYIDNAGIRHPYNDTSYTYTSSYTEIPNLKQTEYSYSINGVDSVTDVSLEDCQNTCSNDAGCGGVVYDTNGEVCSYNSINAVPSNTMIASSTASSYLRNKKPSTSIYTDKVTQIDSNSYNHFVSGTPATRYTGTYELKGSTSVQRQQLQQLQGKLNQISSKIKDNNNKLSNSNDKLFNQSKNNINTSKQYMKDYAYMNKGIEEEKERSVRIDNMLDNSDIVVLQKNYSHGVWTILAIGLLLVTIGISKK